MIRTHVHLPTPQSQTAWVQHSTPCTQGYASPGASRRSLACSSTALPSPALASAAPGSRHILEASAKIPGTSANQQARRSWLFAAAFAVTSLPLQPFHLLFLSFAQMQYPEIRLQIKVLLNPEMGSNSQSQRDQRAAKSPL